MKQKQKAVIIAVVLALGIGAMDWALTEPAQLEHQAPFAAEARDSVPPSEEGLAKAPTETEAPTSESPDDSLVMGQMPDAETVRTQGGENPHSTPRALLDFAHHLAGLMEKALESEQDAGPVFAQLENCASDPEHHEVIQARLICFANASKLAKEYPASLGKRFQLLSAEQHALVGMLESTGL